MWKFYYVYKSGPFTIQLAHNDEPPQSMHDWSKYTKIKINNIYIYTKIVLYFDTRNADEQNLNLNQSH